MDLSLETKVVEQCFRALKSADRSAGWRQLLTRDEIARVLYYLALRFGALVQLKALVNG